MSALNKLGLSADDGEGDGAADGLPPLEASGLAEATEGPIDAPALAGAIGVAGTAVTANTAAVATVVAVAEAVAVLDGADDEEPEK